MRGRYQYSSSGYSGAVSPLSMQSLTQGEDTFHQVSWDLGEGGCGGDFTADPLGAVEPCLNLEVLAQAGRTNKINPETLLRVAVQVSS